MNAHIHSSMTTYIFCNFCIYVHAYTHILLPTYNIYIYAYRYIHAIHVIILFQLINKPKCFLVFLYLCLFLFTYMNACMCMSSECMYVHACMCACLSILLYGCMSLKRSAQVNFMAIGASHCYTRGHHYELGKQNMPK